MRRIANQQGAVLLITLLVVSLLAAATAGSAAIIRRALRSRRAADQAIHSLLIAESGVEDALYHYLKSPGAIPAGHEIVTLGNGDTSSRVITANKDGSTTVEITAVGGASFHSETLRIPPPKKKK